MDNTTINQKQLEFIFFYGSYSIKSLILSIFDIDISPLCGCIPTEEPFIQKGNVKLMLRQVDTDYEHGLPFDYFNDITFLINAAKTVFDVIKEGLEKDGEKVIKNFEFNIDDHHNIYIDGYEDYKLGVVSELVEPVEDMPDLVD